LYEGAGLTQDDKDRI